MNKKVIREAPSASTRIQRRKRAGTALSCARATILILPSARQLGLFPTLALWSALVAIFILFAVFTMHGSAHGRAFVATILAFSFLLAVMLLFAARIIPDRIAAIAGPASGWLLAVILFLFSWFTLSAPAPHPLRD